MTSHAATAPTEHKLPHGLGLPIRRVYVWDLVVRLTHWLIVLSIAVLSVTGYYLAAPFVNVPGQAGDHFFMGWVKIVHFYGSIVFTLAVLTRVVWMFIGNRYARWTELVPTTQERRRGLWETLRFYLFARDDPPPSVGHNPAAGVTYVAIFGLYFVMIITGLALYSTSAHVGSPMRIFGFLVPLLGGLQTARWIHHVVMWLLLGFMVQHVYSAWLMSRVEGNATLESILTGYKLIPVDESKEEERGDDD